MRLLVVRDALGEEARERIEAWVRAGGRLIVTDRQSPLHDLEPAPPPVTDMIGPSTRAPDCGAAALAEVAAVRHAGWAGYEVPEGATACFRAGGQAWLVARSSGRGSVVALGSPDPLLNRALARGDNAVLAAALLAPEPGSRLRIVPPDAGEPPESPVTALVPARLWSALGLAGVALLVGLLALGRRLGRPVAERLPPTIPGAELARSLGDLLQRGRRREDAARRLRRGARRAAGRALGLDTAPPEVLADETRRRLGLPPDVTHRALLDGPVADDEALVAVADAAARVHDRLRRAT